MYASTAVKFLCTAVKDLLLIVLVVACVAGSPADLSNYGELTNFSLHRNSLRFSTIVLA